MQTRRPTRPERPLPERPLPPPPEDDEGLVERTVMLQLEDENGRSTEMQLDVLTNEQGTSVSLNGSEPALINTNGLVSDQPAMTTSPVEETAPDHLVEDTVLTPLRAHYLKKTLVDLQFSKELVILSTPPTDPAQSTLSYLGPPFTPPAKGQPEHDTPFMRFMFRQFALTFPFLSSAPANFFSAKLQPFVSSLLARNLSQPALLLVAETAADQAENSKRQRMFQKLEKQFGLVLGAAVKLVEREEVVRLTQKDLDRLEMLATRRKKRVREEKDVFDVNIVCVRTVVAKGRVRSRAHEEFVIRTRRSNFQDIFVSRRYGDFKTLSDELRKAHPSEQVRAPPQKDRSAASFTATASSSLRSMYTTSTSQDSDDSLPLTPPQSGSSTSGFSPLSREKNRLTLRAYLNSLLSSRTLASSPVLRSFLTMNPTKLTLEEEEDARRREEADRIRDEGRRRFAREVADRVEALRDAVREVKGSLMAKDGLTNVFATVKTTADVRDLPPDYQAVLAWGRISLAATIFQQFVASDTSSETLASLKRIHGMMPYFVLKGILKISNPIAMIRGFLDLFMAAPFGGPSLLQRMFSSSLSEEAKALQDDIDAVKEKIGDEVLCEKIRLFVDAPAEIQSIYKEDAASENISLLAVVLRAPDNPPLNRAQFQRVVRGSRSHAAYLRKRAALDDSDDDSGPQDEDGWLFEDLGILMKLYAKLKDKEQMLALIFEGSTAELLKDIITIFYSPLAQVYKAASIADSLGDLQNFLNDLIRTVEQVEELSQEDPHRTVQTFIDLVQRHEQAFYTFVHRVHAKGSGLFDGLIRWIELFLDLMREGVGPPISLEFLLPHSGKDRADILKEVDDVARYHYRLKIAYEEKIRKRFVNSNNDGAAAAEGEDEVARDLVDGVVRDLSFGELVRGDADEINAEGDDSDSDDYDDSEEDESGSEEGSSETDEETREVEDSPPPPPPPPTTTTTRVGRSQSLAHSRSSAGLRTADRDRAAKPPLRSSTFQAQHLSSSRASSTDPASSSPLGSLNVPVSASGMGQLPKPRPPKTSGSNPRYPDLEHIPSLLPLFVEMVRQNLRPRPIRHCCTIRIDLFLWLLTVRDGTTLTITTEIRRRALGVCGSAIFCLRWPAYHHMYTIDYSYLILVFCFHTFHFTLHALNTVDCFACIA